MRTLKGRVAALGSFVLMLSLLGCGGNGNPFDSVPVSGKIAFDDGSSVGGMRVYFYSEQPPVDGMHPRPAVVGIGEDGTFSQVTTYKYGDGLVLGKHKVSFESKRVPKEYQSTTTTPLVVEVTKSGQFLDIKVPKQ
jgi:hypothetical protein